jgi:hypothetical protein
VSTVDWNAVAVAAANRPTQLRRREHVYESAAGEPLHRTVRVDYSDGSKRIWQQRWVDGEWQNGLGEDFRTVLYQLPAVMEKAKSGGLVLLVEGEKVADAIGALGIVATTAAMGAGSWYDDYAPPLVGAHIVLVPDCDLEGRRHVVEAGRSLLAEGVDVYGPLELHAEEQNGYDLYDLLVEYAGTLRAVEPELDRQAVRDRLRQHVLAMLLRCPPATLQSLARYFEMAEWRVDPKGPRELRHCECCDRARPHTIRAGIAFCPCGGQRQA